MPNPAANREIDVLDRILALQLLVAWAGEGRSEPKRLGWWDTDPVDEAGGGDLLARLAPRTHVWSSLELVREYDEHEPSWLLLRIGLQSCIRNPSERQAEREGLFFAVELATRRLWLTCRQEIQVDWRMLYARCIATASTVFGAGTEGVLASLWKRVASSRWVVCASATLLLEQGMDDERLKSGPSYGPDYFDELLERIRDIRASEKRFYQKIRDLYALFVDYAANAEETKQFFQLVQNKLHWAISGHTAAELIAERADASKPNMGLTTWAGARVRKADVTVEKNYLNEDEIRKLNRIVTMYLDYAEEQAERRRPLYTKDWREKLDGFLKFNEREVLENAGKVSIEVAQTLALDQYEAFSRRRLTEDAERPDEFEIAAKKLGPKKGKP